MAFPSRRSCMIIIITSFAILLLFAGPLFTTDKISSRLFVRDHQGEGPAAAAAPKALLDAARRRLVGKQQHPAAYGKPKPKPKSKPNKLKPKSPPKTNHPPPTPRGNTATSRRGVPNEYDLQARCRPSGLPCDVVLPSDVKNSYTAACAPSLDGDAFASAAAANGTSSLRPERVVIIYGITLIGEPVSTQ